MTISQSTANAIQDALQKVAARSIVKFQRGIDAQGHNLTGRLKGSFETVTKSNQNGIQADILVEGYGQFVDQGVKANRIPYSGRSGRGGKSEYIEGLKDFFIRRGRGASEALRAAFATAAKHRREGMPTRASYRFSRNGKRTDFITGEIPGIETDLVQTVENTVAFALETSISARFR
jgi:hypothetical protein